MIIETKAFFDTSSQIDIANKIDHIELNIEEMIGPILQRFPPKVSIANIATIFNNAYLENDQLFETGLTIGFLDNLMDLSAFKWYSDMPYQYRIAIGAHKGNGGIEEDFLLKDAFVFYAKAQRAYRQLLSHFDKLSKQGINISHPNYHDAYKGLVDLKYEVATYCRLTVISFFSFIESFVNSIGHNYILRFKSILTDKEILTLRGMHRDKEGSYLNLKQKIEKIHQIIRSDKKQIINLTDIAQQKEPFKTFFDYYEALRNASVHFSPEKENIWLGPEEWITKANSFCDLALKVGLEIWVACYPNSDGPAYLGKLNKEIHLKIAEKRLANIDVLK
ncbi:hypothetical protein GCM10022392_26450 [Mucilaginibacter panaciglaebae]|uniref:Uncharacterized protein n=2 Tax=Mucilaginibacter panaciglaebae TaxID=502331 RepID=A0ABP7WZW5_9SPHI